ncbi:hypothetical protein BZA05DRAFT_209065 [Tricharina praecox]|uniref:uncharacterized protein n=1 Tax=Tricharina praecox TaxID=43433 RepID=UPI002220AE50|nr:uncharacterized protein BZA05DRAFT_209065 [Tricharina praecox]KAI5842048.1 hypothetical protein BZA05DRAFT_209065 [Tricharina praecox]
MTVYRCSTSSFASAESPAMELYYAFLLGALAVLVVQGLSFYVRKSSPGTVTLYMPPFRAPTELRLAPDFTTTFTTLLPSTSTEETHATGTDWVLYDLQRQRIIHGVVANEYVNPGGSYLVVSRRGAERGSLEDMLRQWVDGDRHVYERHREQRSSTSAGSVESWVRNAGAARGGTLTPTSSHGTFTAMEGERRRRNSAGKNSSRVRCAGDPLLTNIKTARDRISQQEALCPSG